MAQLVIRNKLPCRAILQQPSIAVNGNTFASGVSTPTTNFAGSRSQRAMHSASGCLRTNVRARSQAPYSALTGSVKADGIALRRVQRTFLSGGVVSSLPRSHRRAAVHVTASTSLKDTTTVASTTRTPRREGFDQRSRIRDINGGEDEGVGNIGNTVSVRGWVRTVRDQKAFAFLDLNDGSSQKGLQAVLEANCEGYDLISGGAISTGAAVAVTGEVVASKGGNQKVEIKAATLELVGACDSTYPLQKKRHSLEFLRGIAHLRPRTNLIGAVARVRSALAYATHQFFQERRFVYVHTPVITASDCEGAGEQFLVTTLMSGEKGPPPGPPVPGFPAEELAVLEAAVKEQGAVVGALKAGGAAKDEVGAAVAELLERKAAVEAANAPQAAPPLDFEGDFFSKPAYLTVSGQLNAETYACALKDVYTFGPTFRAENSNTSRHLAEFWMIEPELAFADLEDDMACAEAYLKHCVRHVLEHCGEDLAFFERFTEKGLLARLQAVADRDFGSITYTAAVDELLKAKKDFVYPVVWGNDLQSEHERYLSEEVFDGTPLMVTDYPKDIKAFYMRENEDGRTVAAMDLLVPRVGELIGGSQREERLDVLQRRLAELDLNEEDFSWYLDLRRYGSVPHAGFGLGFERLVQFVTGVENIRDVIPFPRYPGSAAF